jgi:splicing factor 3B subunit 3
LEAHKNYSICFSITGIDVGFENPTFACLEIDYEVGICMRNFLRNLDHKDMMDFIVFFVKKRLKRLQDCDHDPTGNAAKQVQQTLTFYELDLGLNHVVRKYAEPLAEQVFIPVLILYKFIFREICLSASRVATTGPAE